MSTNTDWMHQLKSITLHVEGDPPPMWPDGASDEYRAARRKLAEAEMALRDQVEAVAALRRALPAGAALPDFVLTGDGSVRLSELFGEHRELVVYHLMFHPDDAEPCPMCSMWVDGFHGVAKHLTQRAAVAVIAKAPIDKLREYGRRRGWQGIPLVSAHDSDLPRVLGVEGSRGGQFPAVTVFARDDDGGIRHVYTQSADFGDGSGRGIDLLSPVWQVWDLLPSGREDWHPHNSYAVSPPRA